MLCREKKPKFKVGDKVRISKYKQIFEKGCTPNWTTEIFTIVKLLPIIPYTYKLKDYQNKPLGGCFYEQELLKAKITDIYLIQKIVRRKRNKVLVKWLGFDDSHNTWENKDSV